MKSPDLLRRLCERRVVGVTIVADGFDGFRDVRGTFA